MKLKKSFLPKYKTSLIRVGRNNDGGYCIARKSILNTNILYSFGLSDDCSFEKDFYKRNPKTKIIVFDRSVNLFFWLKGIIKTCILAALLKKNFLSIFKYFKCIFDYIFFFRGTNVTHIRKNLIQRKHLVKNDDEKFLINLDQVLLSNKEEKFFLKIDIEGNEYRILDDIVRHQKNLEGLVIEFHNTDLMESIIENFIKNINLDLVHIHVNNFGDVNHEGYATVFEATFSPREYNLPRDESDSIFPVKDLDQPNDKNNIDEKLFFN